MATYTYEGKEYLKCSKCVWPRIEATEENIAEHYGYNRLLEPYRTCKKCRIKVHEFYERNKEEINSIRELYPTDPQKKKETRNRLVTCPYCSTAVKSCYFQKHRRTQKCIEAEKQFLENKNKSQTVPNGTI